MRVVVWLTLVLVILLVVPSVAAEKTNTLQPQFVAGLGLVSPLDVGYLESLKGADVRTYGWVQVTNPVGGAVALQLRLEQIIQRTPTGRRPGMVARAEVGLRF